MRSFHRMLLLAPALMGGPVAGLSSAIAVPSPSEKARTRSYEEKESDDTSQRPCSRHLSTLQKRAAPVAASFDTEEFRPLIRNPHVQTIGGFFLRDTFPYVPSDKHKAARYMLSKGASLLFQSDGGASPRNTTFWDTQEVVETPDGDWFRADTKRADRSNSPTVILIHGLESNSEAKVSRQLAQAFVGVGMNCICLNFRGCSGEPNRKLGAYHLGFTDDLRYYLDRLVQQQHQYGGTKCPPIYLAGFSLGANVVLKCLGELGSRAVTDYNIQGASVWCPPLDQEKNAVALAQPGINRVIYTNTLLKSLKRKAQEQNERFGGSMFIDYDRVMKAETITEFDDAYIAPVYNFTDCWHYYAQTSSIHYLRDIAVSTYLLGASDDPFFDSSVWPADEFDDTSPLKFHRTAHGGHLGFCFHQQDSWCSTAVNDVGDQSDRKLSWGPRQMARFLEHAHKYYEKDRRAAIFRFDSAYNNIEV